MPTQLLKTHYVPTLEAETQDTPNQPIEPPVEHPPPSTPQEVPPLSPDSFPAPAPDSIPQPDPSPQPTNPASPSASRVTDTSSAGTRWS